ncbi:Bug family tripartite tricarboxylate transporter substrate binding protein [Rhodoplanes sp. Z2-YC6860]|uniref:Bug family tripartite tricarboxylate transporter substrate binding protein n=1 Tax=Rhodoplanes sp. Z2-YC6860 TaxID=674703 RepID=UPI000A9D82AD|nr:tripartite tricarboxylate transporter substrate binding protein [Rhodoplanes sp. Z2-YC6860]
MRRLLGLAAALPLALGALGFAAQVLAQSGYPDKPIRILVGFSPGVAPDITSRLFADRFNESWAKGVVVENVTGAGGNLAVERTAKSPPDGATIAMGGNAAVVINPNMMDKLGYDPLKDLSYITQVFIVPNILVVPPDVPATTIQELIALAKDKPDYFVAGHAGVGTSQHLGGELFMKMTGTRIQQVPYRGTTAVLPDLMGGRLNIFFGNISNVLPLVREGKLRAFAVTSRKRSPQIPELPTMEELGFPGFDATAWFGLMAPAGTPRPIVDKLHDEAVKILAQPDVRARLESMGLQLVGNTPEQFTQLVKDELPMWGRVLKDAGIKMLQ